MKSEKLMIDGMSCQHCVIAVKKELSKLDVKIKDVKIGSAEIEFDEEKVSYQQIIEAINEAGYEIKN